MQFDTEATPVQSSLQEVVEPVSSDVAPIKRRYGKYVVSMVAGPSNVVDVGSSAHKVRRNLFPQQV